MNKFESDYFTVLDEILTNGSVVEDRTMVGTYSIFEADIKVNLLKDGFPILSCREFNVHQQIVEMIGFMRGIINSQWYNDRGCPFWNNFGLPEDTYKQIRKEDYELAHEYCSYKGLYNTFDTKYKVRFKQINNLSIEEGYKVIEKENITFYKDVLIGKKGDLGPIYGHMWRHWPGKNGTEFDQLQYVFDELSIRPYNRRILVNGWNPTFMPDFNKKPHENVVDGNMSLTPCHVLHEYYTSPIGLNERINMYNAKPHNKPLLSIKHPDVLIKLKEENIPEYFLSLCFFQRSWDFVLGAPANIGGYAAMLIMMAHLKNMIPYHLSAKAVNVHVYKNHLTGIREMIRRYENGLIPVCTPKLNVSLDREIVFIDQFEVDDFVLENYQHLDAIKFPIAI